MAAHLDESEYRATLGALAHLMRASNTHPVGQARDFALLTSGDEVERDWKQGKARVERLMGDVVRAATGADVEAVDERTSHLQFMKALDDAMEAAYTALDRIHRVKLVSVHAKEKERSQTSSIKSESSQDRRVKPQLAFASLIDNSEAPFIPPHTSKHVPHSDPHPMEDALVKALAEAKKLPVTTPIVYDALDDKYPFLWVDNVGALAKMKAELLAESIISVDLEHHNQRTFMGLTCLIQISTRTKDYVIDTLKMRSHVHDALAPIFHDGRIVKVFHGATSDVTWLERDFGLYVVNMFDTYCACKALNLPSESLAFLLLRFCDVPSNNKKSMQREDWRKRPLNKEMLKYARSDTHYLLYIYDRLRQELEKNGSLENVLVNSSKVSRFRYVKPTFRPKYSINIALKRGLDNRGVHALYTLHMWRDQVAREQDESTGFVLSNERCLKIVTAMPENEQQLRNALSPQRLPKFLSQNARAVLQVVKQAKSDPIDPEWAAEVDKIRKNKIERREKAAKARLAAAAAAKAQAEAEGTMDGSAEDATSSCSTTTTDTTSPTLDALSNARRTAARLSAKKKSSLLCFDSESESSSLGSVAGRLLLHASKQATNRRTTVVAAKKPAFNFDDSASESMSLVNSNPGNVVEDTSKLQPAAAASTSVFDLSDSDAVEDQPKSGVPPNAAEKSMVSNSNLNQGTASVATMSKSVFNLEDSEDESSSNAHKVRDEIAAEARASAEAMQFQLPATEDVGVEVDEDEQPAPRQPVGEEEDEPKPLVERSATRRKQKKIEKKEAPPLPAFDYAAAAEVDAKVRKTKKTEKPYNPNRNLKDTGRRVRRTRKNPGSGSRSMTFTPNS